MNLLGKELVRVEMEAGVQLAPGAEVWSAGSDVVQARSAGATGWSRGMLCVEGDEPGYMAGQRALGRSRRGRQSLGEKEDLLVQKVR